MKNSILIVSLILVSSLAEAQLFTFGPKVGVAISSLSTTSTNYATGGSTTGINFGFFFIKEFPGFYLHIEPTYSTGMGGTITSGTKSATAEVGALSLPIMVGKKMNNFRIFFGLAPTGGIGHGIDDAVYAVSGSDTSGSIFMDYVLGAGVDVSSLLLNVRYCNQLAGSYAYESTGTTTRIYMSQIVFSVGLKLNKN